MTSSPCPALCCCRRLLHPTPALPQCSTPGPPDPASASSFQLFRLHHFHLGLELRPESREVAGCMVLELSPLVPGGPALVLDSHPALRVHSVRCRRGGGREPRGGQPSCQSHHDAEVSMLSPCSEWLTLVVSLCFQVWWLDPELSYGSSQLFVFTQGHSVCNRSFFPCFDTPAVKCTYSASVKAPAGIQVLMSCTHSYYMEELGVHYFYMEHPVPAYLVALTAGNLLPAEIGPRSRVWAEPCVLPLAVGKLAGRVEQWLQAAEHLYGPYIWGRYDIVFLPPSFPIVAMENPCLTFVICSILDSEDFLLIDIIHEIAHGWFGNAVTNASWEEMWLSEGLATYAQRRITTHVYGAAFTCLESTFRLEALHRQIRILGQDTPFSKLQAKLDPGVNPSNLMNLFTYEKGFCFVHYLSQLCGDQDTFDAFLRDYIEKFKFHSVVARDLLDSFLGYFPHLRGDGMDNSVGKFGFERWLTAPGPPMAQPDLSRGSVYTAQVEALSELWMTEPLDVEAVFARANNIADWQTFQTVHLLGCSPFGQVEHLCSPKYVINSGSGDSVYTCENSRGFKILLLHRSLLNFVEMCSLAFWLPNFGIRANSVLSIGIHFDVVYIFFIQKRSAPRLLHLNFHSVRIDHKLFLIYILPGFFLNIK
uniref:Arginyl aminopeptidase like 1 n=1 Tax=Leptobrachium leishanense TaxID=445787 RepID=A0A8C5QVB1_9ANUR